MDIEKIKSKKTVQELIKFGIINIDKPSGPTSFQVSQFVKETLEINKTSHLGTLDPMVSGVLPMALSRACRLNDYLINKDKEYVGIMYVHEKTGLDKLDSVVKEFIGKIVQLPPVRSRVKRAERVREIKTFEIIEIQGQEVLFRTKVEAGTYIRKLVHDMGEKIGGAHMTELRRIKASIFDEKDSTNLYDFEKAVKEYKSGNDNLLREMIIPGEVIANVLPVTKIKDKEVKTCLRGSPIFKKFIDSYKALEKDSYTCVFNNEKFIGVYRVVNERELIAVPEFVFN